MIAQTQRSYTVFRNLGWVAIGIFVCEVLCFAFKIAPGYCPIMAFVIDAIEFLAIVVAVLTGVFYPLKAAHMSVGSKAFAVVAGILGGLATLWSALSLAASIFGLVFMPMVPDAELEEMARRAVATCDVAKLVSEAKEVRSSQLPVLHGAELKALSERLAKSFRHFTVWTSADWNPDRKKDEPPKWVELRFGNHSNYGYVTIVVDEKAKSDIGKTVELCPSVLFSTVSMQWVMDTGKEDL